MSDDKRIVERGKLTLFEGKFYTAMPFGELQPGFKTQLGTVRTVEYDDGVQGYWLTTDINPTPRLHTLGSEMIVEIPKAKAIELFPMESPQESQ